MPALLSIGSRIARYLLGDLAPDESRRIEEAMLFDYNLERELETAEEELIATSPMLLGGYAGKIGGKFADLLSSEFFFFFDQSSG